MDYTDEELADLAEMRELRLRLRACAMAKVAECEAFETAKSTLELNRQIRAIDGADRLVVALYTPRRPTRRTPTLAKPPKPAPPPETAERATTYDDISNVARAVTLGAETIKRAKYLRPRPPLTEAEADAPFSVAAAMKEVIGILKARVPEEYLPSTDSQTETPAAPDLAADLIPWIDGDDAAFTPPDLPAGIVRLPP